jgi:23S rRNA pseudouridine2605 synthase
MTEEVKKERIAKVIARAGICSRREAERLIAEGKVSLNGKVLDTPAVTVGPKDKVSVNGKPLPQAEETKLYLFHKPSGCLTTNKDPQGRRTIFDNFPKDLPRVMTVGRLDYNTEGLLLLTNDGELERHLESPQTGWLRKYRVRAYGRVDEACLKSLKDGLTVSGIEYGPIEASLESVKGANSWLSIGIREGKNREVRKIMEALGLEVNRLIRVSYGPFELGNLPRSAIKQVPDSALKSSIKSFFK